MLGRKNICIAHSAPTAIGLALLVKQRRTCAVFDTLKYFGARGKTLPARGLFTFRQQELLVYPPQKSAEQQALWQHTPGTLTAEYGRDT